MLCHLSQQLLMKNLEQVGSGRPSPFGRQAHRKSWYLGAYLAATLSGSGIYSASRPHTLCAPVYLLTKDGKESSQMIEGFCYGLNVPSKTHAET